jgi:hypothetical protein
MYDLIKQVAKIPETVIVQEAKFRWSATTIDKDKQNPQHPTFHSRLLAKLLLWSLTDDFCMTIINQLPTKLQNDGPLFLWTICNFIHRNNIAFVESVKQKIRLSTLLQVGNNVCKYIFHIKDNLCLITVNDSSPTNHNDLLIHVFTQLTSSSISSFATKMKELYVHYLDANRLTQKAQQLWLYS